MIEYIHSFIPHLFFIWSLTMASQFPTLTFDQAKIALDEVIASFEEPEAKAKVCMYAFHLWHHAPLSQTSVQTIHTWAAALMDGLAFV